jgi:transcriptional regulator with XRE-family HTH domain
MFDGSINMPATKKRSYARQTLAAATLLGQMVALERKGQRITAQEFAERLGVTRGTVARLEAGDPKVEIGLAFEACTLLGVPLFGGSAPQIARQSRNIEQHLALLPGSVRARGGKVDDDF